MKFEREIVGIGHEHAVYDSPKTGGVLKVPDRKTQFALRFLGGYKRVKEEIAFAEKASTNSPVKMPETRIYKINNSYVIWQRKIEPDNSISIPETLKKAKPIFQELYHNNPTNFMSSEGIVWWIDYTRGIIARGLTAIGIPFETVIRTRYKIKSFYRRFLPK